MARKLLIAVAVIVLAIGITSAQVNRSRPIYVDETAGVQIGICDLPGGATVNDGWDLAAPGGSWGGQSTTTFAVAWAKGQVDFPTLPGRFAQCTIPGSTGKTAATIEVKALAGLANDSYCIFASVGSGDLLIGCKLETSLTEVWQVDTYTLPSNVFAPGQDITVKILATGNAWPSFNTYGQLAVDYIKILD